MSSESYYVRNFLNRLRAISQTWWTRVEQVSIRGTPDILGGVKCSLCGHAKLVALECKTETGKPTALQVETLRQLDEVGAIAKVVRLPLEFRYVLEQLEKLKEPGPFASGAQGLFEPDQD